MLKTIRGDQSWFVTQPDHAEVSGFLASHWGNDAFVQPGRYGDTPDPGRLRAETVLAIAQHDNGWWEREADPEISEVDGVPLGLADVPKSLTEGMHRWRIGIERFRDEHPYVSLLISFHARRLYAQRVGEESDSSFSHPLSWKEESAALSGGEVGAAREFVSEIEGIQDELMARICADAGCAGWIDPEQLNPHVRLLQLLDGLSLSLCSSLVPPRTGIAKGRGDDEFDLLDVPRRGWEDRVTIEVRPAGGRRIVCAPYPFDIDPLPVNVPVRILDRGAEPSELSRCWWYAAPKQLVRFAYCSQ